MTTPRYGPGELGRPVAGLSSADEDDRDRRRAGSSPPSARRLLSPQHGSTWLRTALVEAAQATGRTKNTYLSAHCARLRTRRGTRRAAVAVGHSILVIAWNLLSTGETYTDLGADCFEKGDATANCQRRLVAQLEAMGHEVTLEPAA